MSIVTKLIFLICLKSFYVAADELKPAESEEAKSNHSKLEIDSIQINNKQSNQHEPEKRIFKTNLLNEYNFIDHEEIGEIETQLDYQYLKEYVIQNQFAMAQQWNDEFKNTVSKNNGINSDKYFETDPKEISCQVHMSNMGVNYSCMDSESIPVIDQLNNPPDDIDGCYFQTIFVVQKNSKKYFAKITDNSYDLEIGILSNYDETESDILYLFEYKIINGRFLGIYSYVNHYGTLRHHLDNDTLDDYEKFLIMLKLTSVAINFFEKFDGRNNLLSLDLLPSNVLMTQEKYLEIRLMSFIKNTESENRLMEIPEDNDDTLSMNKRSVCVFELGKIFFLILFKRYFTGISIENQPEIEQFEENGEFKNFEHVDKNMINLLKQMMMRDPIDRVSLEHVKFELRIHINNLRNPIHIFKSFTGNFFYLMKTEINYEYMEYEDRIRSLSMFENENGSSTEKVALESNLVFERTKAQHLRTEYVLFKGRASSCDFKKTLNQTNNLDSSGLIFFEYNENFIFDNLNENHDNHHHDDHGNHGLAFELKVIIVIMVTLISFIGVYFMMRGMKVQMFQKEDFTARLILS